MTKDFRKIGRKSATDFSIFFVGKTQDIPYPRASSYQKYQRRWCRKSVESCKYPKVEKEVLKS